MDNTTETSSLTVLGSDMNKIGEGLKQVNSNMNIMREGRSAEEEQLTDIRNRIEVHEERIRNRDQTLKKLEEESLSKYSNRGQLDATVVTTQSLGGMGFAKPPEQRIRKHHPIMSIPLHNNQQGGISSHDNPSLHTTEQTPVKRRTRGISQQAMPSEPPEKPTAKSSPALNISFIAAGVGVGLCLGAVGGWLAAHAIFGGTKIVTSAAIHNVQVAAGSGVPISVAAANATNAATASASLAANAAAIKTASTVPVGANIAEATAAAALNSGSNAAATAATSSLTHASTAALASPFVTAAIPVSYSVAATSASTTAAGTAIGASTGGATGAATTVFISKQDQERKRIIV